MEPTILTLDPGLNIGLAAWEKQKFKRKELHYPFYEVIKYPDQKKSLYAFKKFISHYNIHKCYMENAVLMRDSTEGQVTATSGALVKLAQTIGKLVTILQENGIETELVEVASWKGTLPKEVCEKRIKRILPRLPNPISNHVIDAIGIGLNQMGLF